MNKYKFIVSASLLFAITNINAQEIQNNDSVKTVVLDEVTITATKGNRLVKDIPGRIDIIGENQIQNIPLQKTPTL